ncbi:hypothetical protein Tco_1496463, partial [Tanacetum coccineum]
MFFLQESIWVRILRLEEKEKDLQNVKLTFAYRVASDGTGIQYVGSSSIKLEGVYSASSPVGKGQPHIVYGKLEREVERMVWYVIKWKATPTKSLGLKPTAFDAKEKIWT